MLRLGGWPRTVPGRLSIRGLKVAVVVRQELLDVAIQVAVLALKKLGRVGCTGVLQVWQFLLTPKLLLRQWTTSQVPARHSGRSSKPQTRQRLSYVGLCS